MALTFSANISMLFADAPFLVRIGKAAQAGFGAVECHFPYEHAPQNIATELKRHGLIMNGINTPAGDVSRGEFGFAAVEGRSDDFKRGFKKAVDYASTLNIPMIHCLSGHVEPHARAQARDIFLRNMEWALAQIKNSPITLLIEPLNHYDRPHYFFAYSDAIIALITQLNTPHIKLLFDVYHIQIMEGDLLRRIARHWPHIGHFQLASVPERHEPDTGEIHLRAILDELKARTWSGFIGAEYNPRQRTEDGLGWMQPYI